jgi:acyl-CoA reductase-like NAD-dependent aldehyde dehydrogenase
MSYLLKTHAVYVGSGDIIAADVALLDSESTEFNADRLNPLALLENGVVSRPPGSPIGGVVGVSKSPLDPAWNRAPRSSSAARADRPDWKKGYFVKPTVFIDVRSDMDIDMKKSSVRCCQSAASAART